MEFPNIDPVIFEIGPVAIRWYGMMYLLGFAACLYLGSRRAKNKPEFGWKPEEMGDAVFYGALGVILGGRIGYMLFYQFASLADDPLSLFKVWEGGMSFHGGLIGVILGMWYFARKTNRSLLQVTDYIVPLTPIGLGAVRIANFINGELWGRVAHDVPWAMVFPTGGPDPRHPSQLYESLLEGWLLFAFLWWFSRHPRKLGVVSGTFLAGYGIARFSCEFFREPDAHLGFLAGEWLTMGMLLSTPMIIAGIALIVYGQTRNQVITVETTKSSKKAKNKKARAA